MRFLVSRRSFRAFFGSFLVGLFGHSSNCGRVSFLVSSCRLLWRSCFVSWVLGRVLVRFGSFVRLDAFKCVIGCGWLFLLGLFWSFGRFSAVVLLSVVGWRVFGRSFLVCGCRGYMVYIKELQLVPQVSAKRKRIKRSVGKIKG